MRGVSYKENCNIAHHHHKQKKMARRNDKIRVPKGQLKPRLRYKQVNVWKKYFGPIAVLAVYDIYAQKTGLPYLVAKKKDFTECLDHLRSLEYPEYIPWESR